MKKIILSLVVLGFVGTAALAQVAEPDIPKDLSADATRIANILLNPQLEKCISDAQSSKYNIAWERVASQEMDARQTIYTLVGMAIQGDDIAIGEVSLAIVETKEAEPVGFGKMNMYTCKFTEPSVRR